MLIKKSSNILPSEITSKENYLNRRAFMKAGGMISAATIAAPSLAAVVPDKRRAEIPGLLPSTLSTDEAPNSYDDITSYNNYYEFGTGKADPYENAQDFKPRPWTITVDGEAEVTGTFDFDDFVKPHDVEERIYRMRCVEAWSMVIPWVGVPLADVIKRFKPTSKAKYVAFETLYDPKQMPGQRSRAWLQRG